MVKMATIAKLVRRWWASGEEPPTSALSLQAKELVRQLV